MVITFKTEQDGQVTTTEHINFPGDATWPELLNLYINHLNTTGYYIDNGIKDLIFDTIDMEMSERFAAALMGDDKQ
jgi:hypothetical protein